MAIVKVNGGKAVERRPGPGPFTKSASKGAKHAIDKHATKKHAGKKHPAKKHPAKKHQAKKHAAEKHAAKEAQRHEANKASEHRLPQEIEADAELLSDAFHHLQRASALISLLEPDSGGDLRQLLEHGIALYRAALVAQATEEPGGRAQVMECAVGLLRAAEHLAMAGLYTARIEFRERVEPPDTNTVKRHLAALRPRVEQLGEPEREQAKRLLAMARELLRRAMEADGTDPHLDYELTMAADGLCAALERGV